MYSSHIDKYITLYGIFTCEEMDYYLHIQSEHEKSLPEYSQYQLMQIFPEALDYVKEKLDTLLVERDEDRNKINKAHFSKQSELIEAHDRFYDGRIDYYKKFLPVKVNTNGLNERDIERAKEIPISDFIKINRSGFVSCPLHTDKTPSLKVYKDNSWYCFSCHEGGSVVDFIMKTRGVDFLSAVKFLIK